MSTGSAVDSIVRRYTEGDTTPANHGRGHPDHLEGEFRSEFLHTPSAGDFDTQGKLAIGGHTAERELSPHRYISC